MQAAGLACALGVPGWRLMETNDPAERLALLAVTYAARDQRAVLNAEMWFGRGDPS